ncbi:DUF6629 family protein [Leptothoe spongobia]|uniref:Uncharacterized protein n=1 Tax=Leptothoe spongobia TAU-MAC 1115 TaxID=1967444 RepID=A0A947GHY0_9CYAN|nr:DUF6629 family protein [Leptothoe spongobia]MBT9315294.1 hypothetical protein [Leptothoe spongobia TAU-MAC 1115]
MCFSATASFTATALLIPAGLYACKLAMDIDVRYLPVALIPCLFGIQQGFEGIGWLAIHHNQADIGYLAALGFLAFSHGLWLVWLPLAMFVLEQRPWARKVLLVMTLLGTLFGMSLYGPFVLSPGMFAVTVTQGSIDYQTQLIYDQFFPRAVSRLFYMLIVLGPLWLSQLTQLRIIGGFIALALVITDWFYNYAFVSVWCFFAAILSGYILYFLASVGYQLNARRFLEDSRW